MDRVPANIQVRHLEALRDTGFVYRPVADNELDRNAARRYVGCTPQVEQSERIQAEVNP